MTDINDALIELAAYAVERVEAKSSATYRDLAHAVLEAVADDLRADAWDEGYVRGVLDTTSDLEPADNPYRQRADQIEEDE